MAEQADARHANASTIAALPLLTPELGLRGILSALSSVLTVFLKESQALRAESTPSRFIASCCLLCVRDYAARFTLNTSFIFSLPTSISVALELSCPLVDHTLCPSEPRPDNVVFYALNFTVLMRFCVRDFVLPVDSCYLPEASEVKLVKFPVRTQAGITAAPETWI